MAYDSWSEMEALEDERREADFLQARYEAEGRAYGRRMARVARLIAEGKTAAAAGLCTHSAGFPLDSPAAQHDQDPHAGERGFRCTNCGSRLDRAPFDGRALILAPCEVPGALTGR
jgi:hypothetical protein